MSLFPRPAALPRLTALMLAALTLTLAGCGSGVAWCGSSSGSSANLSFGYNTQPPGCPSPQAPQQPKDIDPARLADLIQLTPAPLEEQKNP